MNHEPSTWHMLNRNIYNTGCYMSLEFRVHALGNSLHKTYSGHHKPCLSASQPIFVVVWVVFDLAYFCLWFSIMRECRTTFLYWHMRNLASTTRQTNCALMHKTFMSTTKIWEFFCLPIKKL